MSYMTRAEINAMIQPYKDGCAKAEIKYYQNPTKENSEKLTWWKDQCSKGTHLLVNCKD